VSKNVGVVEAFRRATGHDVLVDEMGHLMGAIGIALLARASGIEEPFDFSVREASFTTRGVECGGCPNNCEVVCVLREAEPLAGWGNRCERGLERAKAAL
jgi:hypothetical protein